MDKDFVKELHEQDLLYLVIASYISSDHLLTVRDCEESIIKLNEILDQLKNLNIEENKKEYYKALITDGIKICERDKEELNTINRY